jgi:dihydrofolate reductase
MISIIAAFAENRVIGVNNTLPWRLPADLRRVKALTTGHHIILGRKNYESIGRPLPDRVNIVVSRQPGYAAPGCVVVDSLAEAFARAKDDTEVFVFGGAEIYRQALPRAQRMYLTLVHAQIAGDTFFPDFDWNDWRERERVRHEPDAKHAHAYSFVTLERK